MIFIVLLVVVVLVIGVFWLVVIAGVFKVESDQNKAERNAVQILDTTFNGRPNVTFTPHMRTLKYETVIIGAQERGYKLTHQTGSQYGPLIFEKVT